MNTYSQHFKNQEFLHEMGLEQRWPGLTTTKFHEIVFRAFLDTYKIKTKNSKNRKMNIPIEILIQKHSRSSDAEFKENIISSSWLALKICMIGGSWRLLRFGKFWKSEPKKGLSSWEE